MADTSQAANAINEQVAQLRRRIGALDRRQVAAWQQMSPARRLMMAFQAYRFALDVVRLRERRCYPDLSAEELGWCVTRRMQGDPRLGK